MNQIPKQEDFVYQEFFEFSNTQVMNARTVYSIIGVFGDVGGVISTFGLIFALFLAPYSEMCFRFKAIQELCMVEANE